MAQVAWQDVVDRKAADPNFPIVEVPVVPLNNILVVVVSRLADGLHVHCCYG